jgi:hypothetical protein
VGRLGLVTVARRPWRAYAAPAAFLLAVTLAVVLLHGGGHAQPKPAAVPVRHPHVRPGPRSYTVAAGDTLAGIATKTHVSLTRLRTLNPNLHPSLLFIGEKIRLR